MLVKSRRPNSYVLKFKPRSSREIRERRLTAAPETVFSRETVITIR
jgi:hypothetical protein